MLPATAFPRWHAHPDAWLLMGLLFAGYVVALKREQARRGSEGEPVATRGQLVAFGSAIAALLLASDWPVHDLAEGYLYSLHMVQHLVLTLVAAPLLLMGTPAWLARKILRPRWLLGGVRGLSRPVQNLVQFNAVLVLSHWPLVVDGTLRHHPLHFVAHAVLLVSAMVMWLPVASPLREIPRLAPPAQMLYLFLQTIVPTVPASFLTFGTSALYPIYATFPRLWGVGVVTDQQVAGLIMKIGGGMFLWVVIAVVFFRWYEREEKRPADVLLWADVEREFEHLDKS